MIVICLDKDIVIEFVILRRVDDTVISVFLHGGTKLRALSYNGLHPFRLLESPRIHISDRRGTLCEERSHGQCHRRIGNFTAVHVNPLESHGWVACDGYALRRPCYSGSHLFHNICECNISLYALRTTASHSDGSSCDCCASKKVTRGTCVSFHKNRSRTDVFLRTGNGKGGGALHVSLDFHVDTKFLHKTDCQRDIGCGDEFVLNGDGDVTFSHR
mmetsp:Transcript_35290/g.51858  ORF Transcript_35290/g.51858 Transcript_35290/m.51858 type:complete len:216 (+) Transcript_35290:270-917(+)